LILPKSPLWGQKLIETKYFLVMNPIDVTFLGFEKIQIFAQNPLVLAYGFTKNRKFGA
jgi:hypothetical protein